MNLFLAPINLSPCSLNSITAYFAATGLFSTFLCVDLGNSDKHDPSFWNEQHVKQNRVK